MSEHPHITTINRMTQAVFDHDRDTLADIFTPDMQLHVRGCLPAPGDHAGVDGFLGALGRIFELTDGNVQIEQLSCLADGDYATEWERCVVQRGDRKLETNNSFVYRFEDGRIAEMWMINTELTGPESFWN